MEIFKLLLLNLDSSFRVKRMKRVRKSEQKWISKLWSKYLSESSSIMSMRGKLPPSQFQLCCNSSRWGTSRDFFIIILSRFNQSCKCEDSSHAHCVFIQRFRVSLLRTSSALKWCLKVLYWTTGYYWRIIKVYNWRLLYMYMYMFQI